MHIKLLVLLLPLLLGQALAADNPPPGASPTPAALPQDATISPSSATATLSPAANGTVGPPTPAPTGELHWVTELRNSPVKAQISDLPLNGANVLTLYRAETTGKPKGTVLVLHDVDGHADWPAIISPLRNGLPSEGWNTLSLQLPLPLPAEQQTIDYPALIAQSLPRVRAAIAELQQRGEKNIIIAGYGLGALSALHYLTAEPQQRNANEPVSGLVIIAIRELTPVIAESDTPKRLAALQIPILDIYGGSDLYSTVASAQARAGAVRKSAFEKKTPYRYAGPTALAKNVQPYQLAYRQYPLAGAAHAFDGEQERIVRTVHGWLDRQTLSTTPSK